MAKLALVVSVLLLCAYSCASNRNALQASPMVEPKVSEPPPTNCSNAKSPTDTVKSGTNFKASLSGSKNVKPNTTGGLGWTMHRE